MSLASTLQTLFEQYGQIPGVSIECQKELVAIGIRNKVAEAEIFLQGAQITRYQHRQGKPTLFLSEACEYRVGEALRGGIPLCWPWFGSLDKNHPIVKAALSSLNSAPMHGFVRERDWQLDAITTPSDKLTIVELSYKTSAQEPLWPFATTLQYRIEVGEVLSVALKIINSDSRTIHFSGALHTYLAISDIDNITIHGLENSAYIDALDNWQHKQQQGDITIQQELDAVYQSLPEKYQITLIDKHKALRLASLGSRSVVIWNPWIEKSKHLSQFYHDDYQHMVCIETANTVDDFVTLAPGQEHTLALVLSE